jgi:D-beta-D-heptose 7-phosphate kinase/D-beta-D-heptose 1-phosphate adenosyltransferase
MAVAYDSRVLAGGVDRFAACRILVVGDAIMDEFVWGRVERISPEAPVPVVVVDRESLMLGGAGNVVNNIVALGGQVVLCGVIGNDPMGRELVRMLRKMNTTTEGLVVEDGRPTTIKTRVVAHSQQVVRVDREERRPVDPDSTEKLLATAEQHLPSIQAIVISDYGKGVVGESLMDGLRAVTRNRQVLLAVDPKVQNLHLYRQVTLITPNHHEAQAMSGVAIQDRESLERAGTSLLQELDCGMVLITQGEAGMTLFHRGDSSVHIPTVARKVFDVSGAGDTVISSFTLSLAAGLTSREAAVVANFAAGIVVGEVGTATVSGPRLQEALLNGAPPRDGRHSYGEGAGGGAVEGA